MPSVLPGVSTHDCLFCRVHDLPTPRLAWHDRPLIRNDGVGVVIPAIGALVPGYVLVSPALHKSSVQELPGHVAERFIAFLDAVIDEVEAIVGPSTVFEHGSCRSEERRRSACITHCHIHIVPGTFSFDSLGLPVRAYREMSDLLSAPTEERTDGYLMYREPGGPVCYAPDAGVSQYFRRQIARTLGCEEEWDYALFPHWPNVHTTQASLSRSTLTTTNSYQIAGVPNAADLH